MVRLVREPLIKEKYRALTLILITISLTLTILSLNIIYSLYTGIEGYISGGPYTLIIYSNRSRTPFTGIINIENLSRMVGGPEHASAELPIPAYVNGTPVIVRGIYPRMFMSLSNPTILEGIYPMNPGYDYAVVGSELARNRHISLGDELILVSIFNKYFTRVRVVGIIEAEYPYNSEILVYIGVARHLRGVQGNFSSIVRIRGGPCAGNPEKFRQEFLRMGGDVALASPERVFEYYSNKIGISPATLLVGMIPPAILSIIIIKYFVGGLLDEHRDHIEVLRGMGYTDREIKLSLLIQFLMYMGGAIAAGIISGITLTYLTWMKGAPSFLIYMPLPSPITTTLIAVAVYLLAAVYYFLHGWVTQE